MYEELSELCEVLSDELREATQKIRGGKLNGSDLEYIDKLTHALKSVTILKSMHEGYGSYDGAYDGAYDSAYDGYARRMSRNSYADYNVNTTDNMRSGRRRRDAMGRYSRDEDVRAELEKLMNSAPDPQTREEIQRIMQKMHS